MKFGKKLLLCLIGYPLLYETCMWKWRRRRSRIVRKRWKEETGDDKIKRKRKRGVIEGGAVKKGLEEGREGEEIEEGGGE